tara:strand:+ start:64 stop:336 length:273 start_codon:yes stop_codon:yes gene_type:complete
MAATPATFCPIIKGDCVEYKCRWWTQLIGSDPQTGQPVNEYDCAVKWIPMLLTENSKETRQTAAAIESFRNRMVEQNEHVLSTQAIGVEK